MLFADVLELRPGGVTPSPFSHPFELSHPVTTPYGLDTANTTVRTALGDAIQQLNKAHIPIDTTLGAVQYVTYHGQHITIPGGPGDPDGIFNAIYVNSEPGTRSPRRTAARRSSRW